MGQQQISKGTCVYCGESFSRADMTRHLTSCKKRTQENLKLEKNKQKKINIFHLLLKDGYGRDYWLHLEMSGEAKLSELDYYLRAIWLECCGHLSQFSYEEWGEEIPMDLSANKVFEPGIEMCHIYDFGDTSLTHIKVIEQRDGYLQTQRPISLMARNDPVDYKCRECGEKAGWLCLECMYNNEEGTFCDKHIKLHPHDEYGDPSEIVNSPRLGMCGYSGPANPPY